MVILIPKNVIFERFWPLSKLHFPACSTLNRTQKRPTILFWYMESIARNVVFKSIIESVLTFQFFLYISIKYICSINLNTSFYTHWNCRLTVTITFLYATYRMSRRHEINNGPSFLFDNIVKNKRNKTHICLITYPRKLNNISFIARSAYLSRVWFSANHRWYMEND